MSSPGDRAFVLRSLVADSLRKKRAFGYEHASARLVGEYDAAGNLIQEIVWLGDIPVATIRTDQGGSGVGVFYIHTDRLNAPSKITRPADNAVIWRWDHDPFGNGFPNEDPDGNGLTLKFNLRFAGQYADEETGLYYNMARYFDPPSGRYYSSDPIGLMGGINTYAYAKDNPLTYIDPTGTDILCPLGGASSVDPVTHIISCPNNAPPEPPQCASGQCAALPPDEDDPVFSCVVHKIIVDELEFGIAEDKVKETILEKIKRITSNAIKKACKWSVKILSIIHDARGYYVTYKECKKCPDNNCPVE